MLKNLDAIIPYLKLLYLYWFLQFLITNNYIYDVKIVAKDSNVSNMANITYANT
jgi:hypothetical protein